MKALPTAVENLVNRLNGKGVDVDKRDRRYRGNVALKFAADEVRGDLKFFNVNLCRLAVDAVAERMRVSKITAVARGNDASDVARRAWLRSDLDQHLQAVLVDALALGSAYLIVWPDASGRARITAESTRQVATEHDAITGAVTSAIKSWQMTGPGGNITEEHIVYYRRHAITHYRRGNGDWEIVSDVDNPLNVVPVVPIINAARLGDDAGSSVIDDMGHLVDALSKVLADMLVASEDVARPRRWASGVDLEENNALDDGFTADGTPDLDALAAEDERSTVSPFESGNRMFTVESPDAKFGQLPGADLAGYRTAVDLLVQQIMAVSALPAHMVGITSANPSSADAIRAAEASLTARAASRIKVMGLAFERAAALAVAIDMGTPPPTVDVQLGWANPATRSEAQEADATTKLHSLGIITTDEARRRMGVDEL